LLLLKKKINSMKFIIFFIQGNILIQQNNFYGRSQIQSGDNANNSLSREQALQAIAHLTFYAGWPGAMSALPVAKRVFDGRQ